MPTVLLKHLVDHPGIVFIWPVILNSALLAHFNWYYVFNLSEPTLLQTRRG